MDKFSYVNLSPITGISLKGVGNIASPIAIEGTVAAGDSVNSDASLDANTYAWYRRVKVTNLM